MIVCGDVQSNPYPGFDKRVRVLYSNIRGLHAKLDQLAVAGLDYDVLICAESKVSDRLRLSELHIPGFGCPQQKLRNSTPRVQFMALYAGEGFRFFRQRKLECSCLESCVFCICSRIHNFYVYAFHHNPGQDGSQHDCLLESMALVQSADDRAVFVFIGDANAHHSECGWSLLLPLISTVVMFLIFAIFQVVSSWFAVPLTLLETDLIL